jgi:hypothetical protein
MKVRIIHTYVVEVDDEDITPEFFKDEEMTDLSIAHAADAVYHNTLPGRVTADHTTVLLG